MKPLSTKALRRRLADLAAEIAHRMEREPFATVYNDEPLARLLRRFDTMREIWRLESWREQYREHAQQRGITVATLRVGRQ